MDIARSTVHHTAVSLLQWYLFYLATVYKEDLLGRTLAIARYLGGCWWEYSALHTHKSIALP